MIKVSNVSETLDKMLFIGPSTRIGLLLEKVLKRMYCIGRFFKVFAKHSTELKTTDVILLSFLRDAKFETNRAKRTLSIPFLFLQRTSRFSSELGRRTEAAFAKAMDTSPQSNLRDLRPCVRLRAAKLVSERLHWTCCTVLLKVANAGAMCFSIQVTSRRNKSCWVYMKGYD
eukprot:sb/3472146/